MSGMIINPYAFGGGAAPPPPEGDPYFDDVELLLHNDSSSFLDSSGTPATIATNSATFDSSVKKWGAGSLSSRANTNYLTATDDGRFGITSEDWTLEMWVAPDSSLGFITARRLWDSQFCLIRASGTDDLSVFVSFNGFASSSLVGTSAINMTLGTFYYVAVTRSGSTFEFRINGSLINSITNATAHDGSTKDVNIGGIAGGANYSRAWLDDIRLTVGTARDVSSVPTEAFPDS
jgi:hypothetical protein